MWEAIIGILGSLASTILNKYQNDASINRMNEYNSPKSQLARYSAAGLSPANIYSQGASAGTQNLIGNYQTSLGSDIVSSVMGASQLRQQKQLQQHQLQLIDAQANNQNAEAALKLLEADWLPVEKKSQIANVIADTLLKGSQKSNVEAQTVSELSKQSLMSAQEEEALTKAGVNRATIEHLFTSIDLMESQIGLNNYDLLHLKPQQAATLKAQADSFVASARKLASEANLNEQQWQMINEAKQDLIDSMKLDDNVKLAEIFYKGQLLTNMQQELKNLKQKYALDEVQSQVTFWTAIADVVAKYERVIPGSKFYLNH